MHVYSAIGLRVAGAVLVLCGCASPDGRSEQPIEPIGSASAHADAEAGTPAPGKVDAGVAASTPDAASVGFPADASGPVAAAPGAADASQPDSASAGGASADAAQGVTEGGAAVSPRELAISADFLNKTLTVFDVAKLKPGAKRADVMVASIDLSKYSPGPLSLNVTPDGKTALVSISAGFLGSFIDVPSGNGTLVFVDLTSYRVSGELFTGKSPMGIAFSKDGKRAFVGHFSENYFAIVDMEKRTFQRVNTGAGYNEELSIDDTGTVGILTYGPAGNVKTFSVDDPAGSLGQTSGLSGDAAGVAFFPGTKYAYLVQAPTVLTGNVGGHNVVQVEDPKRPVAGDNVRMGSFPSVYPAAAVKARGSVVYPSTADGTLSLVEMKLEGALAKQVQSVPVAPNDKLAYGVGATRAGRVLLASSGDHYIAVVDLETKQAFTVPWEMSQSGPTEVKLIP
jgi:DNA-binding beta-propeller fold protein YncE